LMIDETAVANFRDAALMHGRSFVMSLPLAYVSEGAHILWARRRGSSEGVGHRQVYLWRPESEAIRVTGEALLLVERKRAPLFPRLAIDGQRWRDVEWTMRCGPRGTF